MHLSIADLYRADDRQRDRLYAARYGDLPLATVEAIRKLEAANRNSTDAQFAVVLQALLTPAQIDDYMRFNSLLARQIELTLSSIDIDEATYLELLRTAIEREKSATPDLPATEVAKHNASVSSVQTYRRVLGDEAFLKIAARFDSTVAAADAVYQVAGLSPAARADLFMEVYTQEDRYFNAPRSSADRAEMAEAAQSVYRTIVEKAALTPEQIAGFDLLFGSLLKRGDFGGRGGMIAGRAW